MLNQLLSLFRKKPSLNEDAVREEATQPETAATNLNSDRIRAVIAELNQADAIFQEAGFLMQTLQVEIGVTPKVIPRFVQLSALSETEENALLERFEAQTKSSGIIKFVLISLFKASKMKALMQSTPFIFCGIEIDITTAPTVKAFFERYAPAQDKPLGGDEITRH